MKWLKNQNESKFLVTLGESAHILPALEHGPLIFRLIGFFFLLNIRTLSNVIHYQELNQYQFSDIIQFYQALILYALY